MEVLFLIIPISLILVGVILAALFWAIRSQQFDDLDRAAMDPILDDDRAVAPPAQTNDTETLSDGEDDHRSGRDKAVE